MIKNNKILVCTVIIRTSDGNLEMDSFSLHCSSRETDIVRPTTIREFQTVVKEEFGLVLDEPSSRKILLDLINYFDLLAKISLREKVEGQKTPI